MFLERKKNSNSKIYNHDVRRGWYAGPEGLTLQNAECP